MVHFGDQQVFSGATTYTCLLFLLKSGSDEFTYAVADDLATWQTNGDQRKGTISSIDATAREWNFIVTEGAELFRRLSELPLRLSDIAARVFQGLVTGADPVFILERAEEGLHRSEATGQRYNLEEELLHPLCKGSLNLRRYFVSDLTKDILFPYKLVDAKAKLLTKKELATYYPATWRYLQENRPRLEAREGGKWKHDQWYAFGRSQNLSEMEQRKILTPSIASRASYSFDESGYYYFVGSGGGGGGGYGITLKSEYPQLSYHYLLALLNSRLLDWFLKQYSSPFRGGYFSYNRQYIDPLPIVLADAARQARMVALVEQMLDLHRRHAAEANPQVKTVLQRQIDATDRQIDALVYELYGLSEEEIAIVEGRA